MEGDPVEVHRRLRRNRHRGKSSMIGSYDRMSGRREENWAISGRAGLLPALQEPFRGGDVLNAAALTYVAAAVLAILEVGYFMLLLIGVGR
jgi:hypothetical protein